MRTAGVAGLLEAAGVEVAGTRTLGRDLQRLDALADEAQRLAERALERAERAQLLDVIDERGRGAVIELAGARGRALEELERDVDDGLQRDLAVRGLLGDRRDQPA